MWHFRVIIWKAAYGPKVIEACTLNEKTMVRTKQKWNFERGSEVMQPKYHRLEVNRKVKKQERVIQHYSSRNIGTIQIEKYLKTTIMSCLTIFKDRKYKISNLMYEVTLTTSTRHKQRWCGGKIEKVRLLKESPKTEKHENVAGSVWLSLFMNSSIKCKLPIVYLLPY
jgi:hypothetical protein